MAPASIQSRDVCPEASLLEGKRPLFLSDVQHDPCLHASCNGPKSVQLANDIFSDAAKIPFSDQAANGGLVLAMLNPQVFDL